MFSDPHIAPLLRMTCGYVIPDNDDTSLRGTK